MSQTRTSVIVYNLLLLSIDQPSPSHAVAPPAAAPTPSSGYMQHAGPCETISYVTPCISFPSCNLYRSSHELWWSPAIWLPHTATTMWVRLLLYTYYNTTVLYFEIHHLICRFWCSSSSVFWLHESRALWVKLLLCIALSISLLMHSLYTIDPATTAGAAATAAGAAAVGVPLPDPSSGYMQPAPCETASVL